MSDWKQKQKLFDGQSRVFPVYAKNNKMKHQENITSHNHAVITPDFLNNADECAQYTKKQTGKKMLLWI